MNNRDPKIPKISRIKQKKESRLPQALRQYSFLTTLQASDFPLDDWTKIVLSDNESLKLPAELKLTLAGISGSFPDTNELSTILTSSHVFAKEI